MVRRLAIQAVVGVLLLGAVPALAQGPSARWAPDPQYLEHRLYRAMREVVTLPGGRPIAHCRGAGTEGDPWLRCHRRLELFARYMAEASRRYQVSAWTLFAIAVTETGLDPFRSGRAGERGIMQLNPRTAGAGVPFVVSATHRRDCRSEVGACQEEVIDAAARHLAEVTHTCTSEELGLGAYNAGICTENRYVARVTAIRDRWEHAYGHATPAEIEASGGR